MLPKEQYRDLRDVDMELGSERVRRQDKEEKEARCKSAPQYALYIAFRSKFAHLDTPTSNAIFGSLEAQVRTLCSGCEWLATNNVSELLGLG